MWVTHHIWHAQSNCRVGRWRVADETPHIKTGLLGYELGACGGDVRTVLLGGA
jgi:hypothetical protein